MELTAHHSERQREDISSKSLMTFRPLILYVLGRYVVDGRVAVGEAGVVAEPAAAADNFEARSGCCGVGDGRGRIIRACWR